MAFDLRRQGAYLGESARPARAIGARAQCCGNSQAETPPVFLDLSRPRPAPRAVAAAF
jgi:hypothetical protein